MMQKFFKYANDRRKKKIQAGNDALSTEAHTHTHTVAPINTHTLSLTHTHKHTHKNISLLLTVSTACHLCRCLIDDLKFK